MSDKSIPVSMHTITFIKNDGIILDEIIAQVIATFGQPMPELTVEKPTLKEFNFLGYFDDPIEGTQYYKSDLTSTRNWDKASDTTLYARWRVRSGLIRIGDLGL